jgi:hypothetical protein
VKQGGRRSRASPKVFNYNPGDYGDIGDVAQDLYRLFKQGLNLPSSPKYHLKVGYFGNLDHSITFPVLLFTNK